jgi:hypothetical protein
MDMKYKKILVVSFFKQIGINSFVTIEKTKGFIDKNKNKIVYYE